MNLQLRGVTVRIDGATLTSDCSLRVDAGEIVGLIGPNGSGKSTLLRTIYRVLRPASGTVLLGGDDTWQLPAREVARRSAVVAQEAPEGFDFTVEEVVLMGRGPHKRPLDRDDAVDHRLVAEALWQVGMSHLRARGFATLSGGERQRVLVARAVAQQAPILLLDEPTNHLDVRATLDLLELVRALRLTTLCVLHDLNLAATYCERLYLLHDGRIVADGAPQEVLIASRLRDVFGVDCHHVSHPVTGRVQLLFSVPGAGESLRRQ
ncbi:MAG: iron complex transport system ATP-binding protein [Solirubrobacteraceae bacterium]|jgi:iron complex transport system ATP-binding protein|nr:iron complex transport system ATP-binding protein [Solirubrobacteraceae bacterium]